MSTHSTWALHTTGSRRVSSAERRARTACGSTRSGRRRTLIASPWTPQSDPLFVWAVLDCPSAYAIECVYDRTQIVVLASLTVEVRQRPRAGERHVVAAWPVASDGGSTTSLCALRRGGRCPRRRRCSLVSTARSRRLRSLSRGRVICSSCPAPERARLCAIRIALWGLPANASWAISRSTARSLESKIAAARSREDCDLARNGTDCLRSWPN